MAERSIAVARAGTFSRAIAADVTPELLDRYFEADGPRFRIKKQVRDTVVFAAHDILRDPPFSRIDVCTCRNLLIYLEPETQRRVISMLHFALHDDGHLFLGNTESCGEAGPQFEVLSRRWQIFRKTGLGNPAFSDVTDSRQRPGSSDERVAGEPGPVGMERPASVLLLQRALLERYGPPTVVVDRNEQIVYFHGATDPFLRQPAGEPTRDLMQLMRPVLRVVVQALLRAAVRENRSMVTHVGLTDPHPPHSRLQIIAEPVIQSRDPEHFLISFRKVPADEAGRPEARAADLAEAQVHEEVRLLRRELQDTIEAYGATSEELEASNEEASSVNEELQTANEELTTVNNQLQLKIAELQATTSDLENLLSSTHIAVLFLDQQLHVRRYTPAVSELLRLIDADIGRPVTDLALKFTDEHLLDDARAVLDAAPPIEREVSSHGGHRYVRRVLPYRTGNRVAGVVITFIDAYGKN